MYFFAEAKTPIGVRCPARAGPPPAKAGDPDWQDRSRGQDLWQVFVYGEGTGTGKSIRAVGQEKRPESQEKGQEGPSVRTQARGGEDSPRDGGGREARGPQGSQDPQAPARGHRRGEGAEDDQEGDERRRRDVLSVHLEAARLEKGRNLVRVLFARCASQDAAMPSRGRSHSAMGNAIGPRRPTPAPKGHRGPDPHPITPAVPQGGSGDVRRSPASRDGPRTGQRRDGAHGAKSRLILLGTGGGPTPKPNRAAPAQVSW